MTVSTANEGADMDDATCPYHRSYTRGCDDCEAARTFRQIAAHNPQLLPKLRRVSAGLEAAQRAIVRLAEEMRRERRP